MAATTNVMITLIGVRLERLPRLKTVIKSQLTRFGSTIKVEDDESPPKSGWKKGK